MSYRTEFSLEISQGGPTLQEVAERFTDIGREEFGSRREPPETWAAVLDARCPTSWYDHQTHMKAISRQWPQTLFTLRGEDADSRDRWTEYHMNGKVHTEKVPAWQPSGFDPEKLA